MNTARKIGRSFQPLTESQKLYITQNSRRMQILEMARNLKTTAWMVNKFIEQRGLPKKINHPPKKSDPPVHNIITGGEKYFEYELPKDYTWLI